MRDTAVAVQDPVSVSEPVPVVWSSGRGKQTKILVLNVLARFSLGLDDVVALFREVLDEHFLDGQQLPSSISSSTVTRGTHCSHGDHEGGVAGALHDIFVELDDLFYPGDWTG